MLVPLTLSLLGVVNPGPPPGWIQWEAPAHCPSAISVVHATQQRLGRTVDDDELRLEARLTEDDTHATVEFSLTRSAQTERRTLVGPNCATLTEAVALLVAMSLDPVHVATQLGPVEDAPSASSSPATRRAGERSPGPRTPPPGETSSVTAPPPLPTSTPAPQATPADHDTPPSPREREARLDVLLQAGGGLAVGAIPRISGGPQLGLVVAWPRIRFETGGYWIAPRSTTDGRVAVQMGAAWLRTCTRLGPSRVEFPICLGAELGALRGRGGDVLNPQTQVGLWVAPQLGAGVVGWVAQRAAITLRANTAIPVVSSGFVLEGGSEGDTVLFTPQRLALHVWLGVEGKFRVREGSPR